MLITSLMQIIMIDPQTQFFQTITIKHVKSVGLFGTGVVDKPERQVRVHAYLKFPHSGHIKTGGRGEHLTARL